MIDRRVRRELLGKLRCSPQALSQRAKRLKDKYGPMTTDEAVYVIAHMEGIDVSKHLPLQAVDRIRSLVPREIADKTAGIVRNRVVKKARRLPSGPTYPLVKSILIQRAITIGEEAFPQVFVLENSIRALIAETLSKSRADWWTALVPSAVQGNVQRTMNKEKKHPYREKRGREPLMYCNFDDLKQIVLANEPLFSTVILDCNWFESKMNEIYMARNNLAHSVPLSKDDISRIALFYRDWARLLDSAGLDQLDERGNF